MTTLSFYSCICPECGHRGTVAQPWSWCPRCGSVEVEAQAAKYLHQQERPTAKRAGREPVTAKA